MTRERAKELAPIIKAYGEGKMVVCRPDARSPWVDIRLLHTSDDLVFPSYMEYRIAQDTRRRQMTRDEVLNFLAGHPNSLVRVCQQEWQIPGMYDYNKPSEYFYCLVENGVRTEPR